MRPRGESISSPQSRYVGHVGRQNPQWTHLSISAGDGMSEPANALVEEGSVGSVGAMGGVVLNRSAAGVEHARGIEHLFDAARHYIRVASRSPDIHTVFELTAGAKHNEVPHADAGAETCHGCGLSARIAPETREP